MMVLFRDENEILAEEIVSVEGRLGKRISPT